MAWQHETATCVDGMAARVNAPANCGRHAHCPVCETVGAETGVRVAGGGRGGGGVARGGRTASVFVARTRARLVFRHPFAVGAFAARPGVAGVGVAFCKRARRMAVRMACACHLSWRTPRVVHTHAAAAHAHRPKLLVDRTYYSVDCSSKSCRPAARSLGQRRRSSSCTRVTRPGTAVVCTGCQTRAALMRQGPLSIGPPATAMPGLG